MAWRRIEQAMKLGEVQLVRYLRRFVPQADRHVVDTWIDAYKNPSKVLGAGGIHSQWPRAANMVIHSLQRWARYDSPAAAVALDELRTRFDLSGPELAALEHYIALSLAQRGDKQALSRLNAIPAATRSKEIREWRARTYLRDADWSGLAGAIQDMPPELEQTLRWRYWRARSLDERGMADAAEGIFREVAQERDYYGFLAAGRVGQPYQLRDQTLEVDQTTLAAVASDGAVLRAGEFVGLGRVVPARLEWRYAIENATVDELRAAAWLASSWGWHSEAIATVARAGDWDDLDLRFPIVHRRQVTNSASNEGIEPEWIYAIARQESMFREDAKSVAGALGLMQLLPTTAKRVAAGIDLTLKNHSRLLDPDVNIRLGSRYLRLNREKFQGNALLATAAYNAGPHRVEKWLPEKRPIAADIWVETIPFTETRRYVRRVMEYSVVYGMKLNTDSDFFSHQTIPITPAGEAASSSLKQSRSSASQGENDTESTDYRR
jgi:soluble lytic murein transglycosylase